MASTITVASDVAYPTTTEELSITGEKLDLRVRRTRALLLRALLELLADRRFEDISVTELCERAMVNRATFYKHYADKHDLVRRGFEEMLDSLAASVAHPNVLDVRYGAESPPAHFVLLFRFARSHAGFFQLMLGDTAPNLVRSVFVDWLNREATSRLGAIAARSDAAPTPLMVRFATGALVEALHWWVTSDTPYSPEQMAEFAAGFYRRQFSSA